MKSLSLLAIRFLPKPIRVPTVLLLWLAVSAIMLPRLQARAQEAASRGPVFERAVTIRNNVSLSGVELAIEDLASDLQKVLGAAPKMVDGEDADILVLLDEGLGCAESYRIDVAKDRVSIAGADELGVIYGVYV